MDRLESIRAGEEQRAAGADEGILLDQLDEVESRLLAFAEALGADVDDVRDLPFTEEAGKDNMPQQLYVRHDPEMLNQMTTWLLQDQHIGLISQYGTGKSAFREVALRDLRKHDGFVAAFLANPDQTTPRQIFRTILEAATREGYEIDRSQYSQIRDGIPWATDEVRRAAGEVVEAIRADGRTILLLVDEIEVLGEELLSPLQSAGDAGVRLFLMGTPEGKQRIQAMRATLDSRLRYYEGIKPFEPKHIAEYIGRSLAYMRDEPYEGGRPELFSPATIRDIHDRTGGVQREVRIECRELFTRAAFVWYRTGQPIERITITPNLRERRFGMGR